MKLTLTPYGPKQMWNVHGHPTRSFILSKSQFGWHVAEMTGGMYKQHALGCLSYRSKAEALAAIQGA